MRHLEQIPSLPPHLNVEVKRQELCAALSRDACRQMLDTSKPSVGEVTMSAAELGKNCFPNCRRETVLEILTYVCLLQGFSADI